MERDDEWLASERQRLLGWPREKLIGWLGWNDPNGVWSDEDMAANDMDPMTVEDAVEQVMVFVEETRETPEEMMGGSLKANPGRYPKPAQFDPWLKGSPMPERQPTGYERLKAKDPSAARALYDMLGREAFDVAFDVGPDGYVARLERTGEEWEYDGAEDMWIEA